MLKATVFTTSKISKDSRGRYPWCLEYVTLVPTPRCQCCDPVPPQYSAQVYASYFWVLWCHMPSSQWTWLMEWYGIYATLLLKYLFSMPYLFIYVSFYRWWKHAVFCSRQRATCRHWQAMASTSTLLVSTTSMIVLLLPVSIGLRLSHSMWELFALCSTASLLITTSSTRIWRYSSWRAKMIVLSAVTEYHDGCTRSSKTDISVISRFQPLICVQWVTT